MVSGRQFKLTLPAKRPPEYDIPTSDKINRLMEAADPKMRMCIALAGIGTLRRGEICGLKYKDVLYDFNAVYVHTDEEKKPSDPQNGKPEGAQEKNDTQIFTKHTQAILCKKQRSHTVLSKTHMAAYSLKTAGNGNRTHLPGLGSQCTTDVLYLQEQMHYTVFILIMQVKFWLRARKELWETRGMSYGSMPGGFSFWRLISAS